MNSNANVNQASTVPAKNVMTFVMDTVITKVFAPKILVVNHPVAVGEVSPANTVPKSPNLFT